MTLTLSQTLYTGGRAMASYRSALLGTKSESFNLALTKEALLFEIARAYYEALKSKNNVRIAVKELERLEAHRTSAEKRLQVGEVGCRIGVVRCLDDQFALALQQVGNFVERAFSGLRHRDAVVGIANALVHAAHLRGHAGGDGEAGSVVLGRVDTLAGRQAFHGGSEGLARGIRCIGGLQRADIGVDDVHG